MFPLGKTEKMCNVHGIFPCYFLQLYLSPQYHKKYFSIKSKLNRAINKSKRLKIELYIMSMLKGNYNV